MAGSFYSLLRPARIYFQTDRMPYFLARGLPHPAAQNMFFTTEQVLQKIALQDLFLFSLNRNSQVFQERLKTYIIVCEGVLPECGGRDTITVRVVMNVQVGEVANLYLADSSGGDFHMQGYGRQIPGNHHSALYRRKGSSQ